MNWAQFALTVGVSCVSALFGGAVGGWLMAFRVGHRVGQWQATIDQRLTVAEKRLEKGDEPVGEVPVLGVKIDGLAEQIKKLEGMVSQVIGNTVTTRECERRHERDG